jgi:hypothetical protein
MIITRIYLKICTENRAFRGHPSVITVAEAKLVCNRGIELASAVWTDLK